MKSSTTIDEIQINVQDKSEKDKSSTTIDEIQINVQNKSEKDKSIYSFIYNTIQDLLKGHPINPDNLIDVTLDLMKKIESNTKLRGYEKKNVIIQSIQKYIDSHTDDDLLNREVFYIADTVLGHVIDKVISLDSKEIRIKSKKFFKCCIK